MNTTETMTQMEIDEILYNNNEYTLYSWSKQKGLNPINVERAEGIYLYDYSGKRYIDFSSGLMNVNIGHGDQRVTQAVAEQMQQVSYISPSAITKIRGEVGKKLAEISPGSIKKTLFTVCGASSIENAIKLARHYTGRHKIISRYRSFHGATYGAMTVGGDPRKIGNDSQQMPNAVHVEDPYCYRCPWSQKLGSCQYECASHIERVVEFEGPETIAAILMEGESGSSGCFKYPPEYLKKVKAICEKHGILFIADEVMSGFGRTGQWFGVDNYDVEPDIIATAKGITSGYLPLGAVMVTEKIASHYDNQTLLCGLTYSAHPVSLAASLAVLNIYEEDNLIENTAKMGKYLDRCMSELMAIHPSIGDWRNTGLLGCIELVKNRDTKEPMAPFNAKPDEMVVMNKELGLYTFIKWNYVFVAPPLCITKDQIDESLSIISEALKIADAHTV
jgi:taurine---2-oxoglutarate transaminase